MGMTIGRLRRLLDSHGADRSRWPAGASAEAERLIATDPAAAELAERARRLDATIARGLETWANDDVIAARAASALAGRPLPPQRANLITRFLPFILLDLDLSPAWPRVAALVGVAVLGFLLGLAGLEAGIVPAGNHPVVAGRSADPDLGVLLFDVEPVSGASLL